MQVLERMKAVLSKVEIELADSLPIWNRDAEVLFFYDTEEVDENSFRLKKIRYIFSRDQKTNIITEVSPEKIFQITEPDWAKDTIVTPQVFDEEAYDLEDEYDELYEEFKNFAYQNTLSGEQQRIVKKLYDAFTMLVPESALREVYEILGQDMIQYLEAHAGETAGKGQ